MHAHDGGQRARGSRPMAGFAGLVLVVWGCFAPLSGSLAAGYPAAAVPQRGEELAGRSATVRLDRRSMQRLTPEHLRRAIAAYLEVRLEGQVSDLEVEVVEPSEVALVPAGLLRLEITAGAGVEQSGRRRFHVVPTVDGRPTEPIDVVTDVSLFAEAVVPTRMIKSEEVIEPEDVATARVKVTGVPHQLVTQLNEAIGKSPGRILHPQQPIRTTALVKPYAVRKGDRVTIEARRGGLAIQTVGTTKAAAQMGAFVTVTNTDSGKDIRAKVVGPGLVQVDF